MLEDKKPVSNSENGEDKPAASEGSSNDSPRPDPAVSSKTPKAAGNPRPRRNVSSQPRGFPVFSLERSLAVAEAIKEKNAGNPWPPTEVSKALGFSERSSSVDLILKSSAMYGLTTGTRGASYISLEKFGREIVYAPNLDAELQAKQRAFLNVELFSKVLGYYKGNNLPETQFLSNTLVSEFSVPVEYHEEFKKLFDENCRYVGIGKAWNGLAPVGTHSTASEQINAIPNMRSYASEANSDGRKCFVIMPFSERSGNRPAGFFDEVFDSLIKPAAEAAGFDVYTANKDGSDVIQSTIINELIRADIVLADLTDHNPNALFELGVRLALQKPVAIIKSIDTGRVFDVDNMMRVFEYSQNLWTSTVKSDLSRLEGHLRASWDGRETTRSYMSILSDRE